MKLGIQFGAPVPNCLGQYPLYVKLATLGNQNFLLFPQCFSTLPKTIFNYSVTFILSSAYTLNLDQSKILSIGKG